MVKKRKMLYDNPKKLHKKTLELYLNRPRTINIENIHLETDLPIRWIKNFPKAIRPSVNRVEVLYNYLSEEKLIVN